jgi:hypothetical protein
LEEGQLRKAEERLRDLLLQVKEVRASLALCKEGEPMHDALRRSLEGLQSQIREHCAATGLPAPPDPPEKLKIAPTVSARRKR